MNMKAFLFALPVFFATTVSAQNKSLSAVLNSYYKVKNELVAGNSSTAAVAAAEFKTAVATVDHSILTAADLKTFKLVKQNLEADAANISTLKDLNKQREVFSALSNNMIVLVKAVKLSEKEVYVDYCPMKKASWLSGEKAIRNPYYGNQMLTCGSVKETIKQ